MSIFTTFAKQSMINQLSNPINHNRSAAKISKVMSSSEYSCSSIQGIDGEWQECTGGEFEGFARCVII